MCVSRVLGGYANRLENESQVYETYGSLLGARNS